MTWGRVRMPDGYTDHVRGPHRCAQGCGGPGERDTWALLARDASRPGGWRWISDHATLADAKAAASAGEGMTPDRE